MIRRPPRSTLSSSSAASDVYKRQIKDWIGNVPHHEWHIRTLQNLSRPVNVLTTHSSWLFASLALGPSGLLSGSGSVIADLQAKNVPRGAERRSRRSKTAQRPHRAD